MTFKQIKASIKSRLEFKKELTNLQKKRLRACRPCKYNSDNIAKKTFKQKVMMLANKVLNSICGVETTEDAVCFECEGCQLIHKSTQTDKDLICRIGKWDNL